MQKPIPGPTGPGAVSALVLALACTAAAHAADGPAGRWLSGKASVGDSERDYKLYVPANRGTGPAPLVVMLHGCTQTPEVFAESTRMNRVADGGQFLVLYPAQKLTANPTLCWNWFLPKNQARDSGEPGEIVALVHQVAHEYGVDRQRIYVSGLSAGGSMAAILAACYPDIFAAAAIHGGTMYKAATSLPTAQAAMVSGKSPSPEELAAEAWACGGQRRLPMPVAVWHGQGDNIVNRANGEQIVRQFARLNDWADDGQANNSAPQKPATRSARVDGGHAYTVASYAGGGGPLITYYQVADMGHAWSGGKASLPFSDGKGPDASLLDWNFFKQFRR